MSDDPLNILLVFGSVRDNRQGWRLVRYLEQAIAKGGDTVSIVDPLEHPLPLLTRMYKEFAEGEAPWEMEAIAQKITACDAVIVVSAEYNHGIPPALKNTLDHFLEEWLHRPAGIASYSAGRYGGVRAAMQLRMTLAELGLLTIPTLLPVPTIGRTLSEDGSTEEEWLDGTTARFIKELCWWARAAKTHKAHAGLPR